VIKIGLSELIEKYFVYSELINRIIHLDRIGLVAVGLT